MAYQVEAAASALADTDIHLLNGLPTAEAWTPSHPLAAEPLSNARYGRRSGRAAACCQTDDGIALYPYRETGPDEWAVVDALP